MNIDLSICQEALNRDPVLYLDLTEAIRRGEGRLIAAMPRGALVSFRNYEKDGQELGFTMFADDLETAKRLLAMLPPQPDFLTVHEDFYLDELEKRFGFDRLNPCWQVGYLRTMAPAAPDCEAEIRQLELSRGRVPYGQVFDGNEASLALQQSLGMTRSMGRLYWAVRND